MARTNKCLAQSNKSETRAKATKQQINPIRRNPRRVCAGRGQAMTLQEAKSIVRHLGLTLRKVRSGDYCVKSREGNEATPYYTDDLEDAVNTAVRMARKATRMTKRLQPKPRHSLAATNKRLAHRNKSRTGAKRLVRRRSGCYRSKSVHCDEKRERTKPHGLWQAVGEIDNLEMLGAPTSKLQAYLDASTAMQPMLGSNPETEALAAHRRTVFAKQIPQRRCAIQIFSRTPPCRASDILSASARF